MIQSLEEYITSQKNKARINEFDMDKRPQNMKQCINYVIDYYNDYLLNADDEAKEQTHSIAVEKYQRQIKRTEYSSEVKEWFIEKRDKNNNILKTLIERFVEYNYECYLFTLNEEFMDLCNKFVDKYRKKMPYLSAEKDLIIKALKDTIYIKSRKIITPDSFPEMNDKLFGWIHDTHSKYGVDLFAYMWQLILRNYLGQGHQYDPARIKTNDFPLIDSIYETVKYKPFLTDKKTEFESLFVFCWSGPDDPYFIPDAANNPYYKTKRQLKIEKWKREAEEEQYRELEEQFGVSRYYQQPTKKGKGNF